MESLKQQFFLLWNNKKKKHTSHCSYLTNLLKTKSNQLHTNRIWQSTSEFSDFFILAAITSNTIIQLSKSILLYDLQNEVYVNDFHKIINSLTTCHETFILLQNYNIILRLGL